MSSLNLDWVVAGLVLSFAVWGLFVGAARQIARVVGIAVAYLAAGPAGQFVGLPISHALTTSLTVGTVIGTFASFVFLYLVVHLVTTAVLRRFFDGPEGSQRRGLDRVLGFALGGLKAAAFLYVALCAASFLETNVTLLGKQLVFTPKHSVVMQWVRRYNLLELQQFGGVSSLVKAVKAAEDPKIAAKYKNDPDFVVLQRDPRFVALLHSEALKKALESSDVRSLLANNQVVELLQDSRAMERVERIAEAR